MPSHGEYCRNTRYHLVKNFNKINKLYSGIPFAKIPSGSDSSYPLGNDGDILGQVKPAFFLTGTRNIEDYFLIARG